MFLLGRQAMLGHDPPIYLRSIAATRCPRAAKVHAAIVDPVPPPRIRTSYCSAFCPRNGLLAYCFPFVDQYRANHVAAVGAGKFLKPLALSLWFQRTVRQSITPRPARTSVAVKFVFSTRLATSNGRSVSAKLTENCGVAADQQPLSNFIATPSGGL